MIYTSWILYSSTWCIIHIIFNWLATYSLTRRSLSIMRQKNLNSNIVLHSTACSSLLSSNHLQPSALLHSCLHHPRLTPRPQHCTPYCLPQLSWPEWSKCTYESGWDISMKPCMEGRHTGTCAPHSLTRCKKFPANWRWSVCETTSLNSEAFPSDSFNKHSAVHRASVGTQHCIATQYITWKLRMVLPPKSSSISITRDCSSRDPMRAAF